MRQIEAWLSEEELAAVYTSSYWNDVAKEQQKEWWVADKDYAKCLNLLTSKGLLNAYDQAKGFISSYPGEHLIVADIAAGIGWASSLLSKLPNVGEVHAVEISRHRLEILFEHSLIMFSGDASKIFRHLGSFYDLRFDDKSVDIIFMSQAFHHADKPLRLLIECDRVLKESGRIILIGEHRIGTRAVLTAIVSSLRRGRIPRSFCDLFPPDNVLGDHYYRRSDYYFVFRSLGYNIKHKVLDAKNMMYVADKED